jgi:hypothetical protein
MFVFVSVSESRGLLWHLVHNLIYIKINKMVAFSLYPLCIWLGYVESHSPFLPNHHMVNTRNNQCNGLPSSNNNNNNAHQEQLLTTQTQLMQAILQTLNNMQPNQQQVPPPPPPHQSLLAEFLRTHPTTFSQAKDPMDVEDWLKGVEKKLVIAQCTDREKVLFAAHQLYGTAANWWETYCNTHANVDTITWNDFKAHFRTHYVPRGTMKLKRKEFSNLKQGGMTVNEYLNSFIQLSRYAPNDINTDEKRQDVFLSGLNVDIQFQLLNTDYAHFQHMVDKAIVIENKIKGNGEGWQEKSAILWTILWE